MLTFIKTRIAACVMLGLLVVFVVLSTLTLVQHYGAFAPVKSDKAEWYQGWWTDAFETWFEKNLAARKVAIAGWGALRYGLMNTGSDGVVIGQDGWLFTNEEFTELPDSKQIEIQNLTIIDDVQSYLRMHDIELMVAFIPAKSRIYDDKLNNPVPYSREALYERFHHAIVERVALAPNLSVFFNEKKSSTQMFMKSDTHWTPDAAALVAHFLASIITAHRPELIASDKRYITLAENEKKYDGDLNDFIPTGILKNVIGPASEPLVPHITKPVEGDDAAEDSLFGDEQIPIVLVGTSYSYEKEWNFEGALRLAFGADVLNVADEGKGPMRPMVDWLIKTDLRANPPKLVIWEIPERFMASDTKVSADEMKKLIKKVKVGAR
jgi:alginate O-acetyltransferase complex protein AlgJ